MMKSKSRKHFSPGAVLVRYGLLLLFGLAAWLSPAEWLTGLAQQAVKETKITPPVTVQLGQRLFRETRFSTEKGDLPASCSTCHLLDEDPQGLRAYADFFNRSWFSWRDRDPQRFMLRNAPTILDAALMPRLHYDGEFGSLEELVKGTFAGRPMGWLPGEEPEAFRQIQAVLLADKGSATEAPYREFFRKAYHVELGKLSRDKVVNLTARAVADFMRTLNTAKNSAWDEFIRINRLDAQPAHHETSGAFARRMLDSINELETGNALKLSRDFNAEALKGAKIFFTTSGSASVGNCVTCHAPPLFTDFSYHNIGISQAEYDQLHGAGKFAALEVPNAATAARPVAQFRAIPSRHKPAEADLGYWNFVDLKTSELRRAGESDDQLLARMIGAIKTPTLRHLAWTPPYLHNGAYFTLEEVVQEKIRLSALARAGKVREADDELKKIHLSETDIAPLVAFLNALNEDLKRRY